MRRLEGDELFILVRQGLAGAGAGLLGFLLLERGLSGGDFSPVLVGLFLGGLIAGGLTMADELSSGRPGRILLRGALAGVAGTVLATLSALAAGAVYSSLGFLRDASPLFQILARTLGWGLFGLGVGCGAGLPSLSGRRVGQGCLGGLAGGLVGGFLFDAIAVASGGTLSRLVGFTAIGTFVGLATALAEQLGKVAWISFQTGAREGHRLLLHRDRVVLGRDELADVPLFGDPAVAKAQAEIHLLPAPAILETGPPGILRVDGRPVSSAPLLDGTLLELGSHRLRFHHRHAASAPLQPSGASLPLMPAGVPAPSDVPLPDGASPRLDLLPEHATAAILHPPRETAPRRPQPRLEEWPAPGKSLTLRVMAGPEAGRTVLLAGGAVTLGREAGNALTLTDKKISRYHARIEAMDGAWVLHDLGSTNGTRLNGVYVKRAGLAPGDFLYLGDTALAVELADLTAGCVPTQTAAG